MNILLIGNEWSLFDDLAKGLSKSGNTQLVYTGSTALGLEQLREKGKKAVDLVIVGGHLSDRAGIRFIRQLVRINPLANSVLVGSLPDDEFHNATEGLGVLMQLPPRPTEKDGEKLLEVLGKITGLMMPAAVGAEKQ
ncbi:MAG TPA: response regulator transcription factor [Desulfobacteraceae bacterium]|nr:response regulator transcription factor [Desulfobacteraceae bacterium]